MDPNDNALDDSDLESQMDDYMIDSTSSTSSQVDESYHSSDPELAGPVATDSDRAKRRKRAQSQGSGQDRSDDGKQDSEESASASEESVQDADPQEQLVNQMRDFYDRNYRGYEVCADSNFLQKKVWKIVYD